MKQKGFYFTLACISMFVLGVVGYIFILFLGNYVIDEKKFVMNSATRLVDQNGQEITKLYVENRDLVTIKQIPEHVQQAFISVEDVRFYHHHGIDVKAIGRALYRDLVAGGKVEGGSTITQQLAKNIFLTNDKTLLRKTKEVVIAINLEKRYSKKKLLEMYLNQIYFGHGAYGIEAASHLYFNKDVSDLTVEQGALLAALPKAPNSYSPILHPEKSLQRRNVVLNSMQRADYLSAEEVVRLQGRTLGTDVQQRVKEPAFLTYIDMVMEEAKTKYHLSNEELLKGGYKITVPMSRDIQNVAFDLFQENKYFPGTDHGAQGSFLLMDNQTGGVLSAIGGRDYVQKGLNRLQVKRQPGSIMKPLAVYGPALQEKLFRPYSLLEDKQTAYNGYIPRNIDGSYEGEVTMYDALKDSKNAPAVWALNELGVRTSKDYLNRLGMPVEDKGLAIALGGLGEGVSPVQLVSAYRAFATTGSTIQPYFIQKIEDRENNVIAKAEKVEKKVFSKQTAWYMTRMLEGVVEEGTAQSGTFEGALAGKTGSTSYSAIKGATRDTWFVGYTPDVVGAVWMGYDKTNENHYLTKGSSYPTRLFKDILMQSNLKHATAFNQPSDTKDLEAPIRLHAVDDLSSDVTFKPLGLFTVKLQWTPSEDERVIYHVYEERNGEAELVAKVEGQGAYEVERVNVLHLPTYYVVPYNKQTKKHGKQSNEVIPAFFGSEQSLKQEEAS
ncbi:PBP1A family penicillin-binding protein [Bacillus sp. CGMCC 1.16541]|uniref:transglycosylase domain-containing protein n=1 Tax=Bacillus sp. CGMCC 1.16541 TaxID=2185143 RepID=UPI000D739679|nr:PBP1A family penicillin-binding protein [Bacillus sp. CGMCC 1.16541]